MGSIMNQFIELCVEKRDKFSSLLAGYSMRGILHSEMLLFVTHLDYFGIEHVIESGRAEGQSTKIIAKWISNKTRFDSIDIEKEKKDYSQYNVNIHQGNSISTIPKLLSNKKTAILIDGPKGEKALELAKKLLKHKNIAFVALHDFHKDTYVRNEAEKLGMHSSASDDFLFVERFHDLDAECWSVIYKKNKWLPYDRNGQKMTSYGPTLLFLYNEIH